MSQLHLVSEKKDQQRDTEPIVITHFPCIVGRAATCDVQLDDLMVSRRHCIFTFRDDRVWVEDLASRNGTRLNGESLCIPQFVEDGDTLVLADLAFQVRLLGGALEPEVVLVQSERANAQTVKASRPS
jgi:pSer/pThr/pTyr-binding forkhead associated (FHA) protein